MKAPQIFRLLALAAVSFGHGDEHTEATIASVDVADFKSDFAEASIVPDILPAFNPTVSFYAGYKMDEGMDMLLQPGMNLSTTEAAMPFEFSVEGIENAANVTADTRFLVYLIGPDAPSADTPTARNVRHYLAGNMTLSSNSTLLTTATTLTNSSAATNEYAAPVPSAGTGVHRYVYLLYVQPTMFDTVGFESVGLNVSNRMKFNLTEFRAQAGLGPSIGGTYFTIDAGNSTTQGGVDETGGASKMLPGIFMAVVATILAIALL